jgi:hypothetical protein
MNTALERMLSVLPNLSELAPEQRAAALDDARRFEIDSLDDCRSTLDALPRDDSPEGSSEGAVLAVFVDRLSRRLVDWAREHDWNDRLLDAVAAAYQRMGSTSRRRHQLLSALATAGRAAALERFVSLVCACPPARGEDAAMAFAPLFQRPDLPAEMLFPKLLAGLEHPSTAAIVLDLANYLVRKERVAKHPAADRGQALAGLLGETARRLARIEERPAEFAASPAALAALIGDAVTLVVSLCDALAQIGDPSVAGKLHQALGLSHRRVRAEAAAALARLDDEAGFDELAALCAEPSVRVRALAYLSELGREERAAEAYRSPVARAEGDLAAWLALPTRIGIAPNSLELVDSRSLSWPGYDAPVECYLFRYTYGAGDLAIAGIGIAGPTTHAFGADLADLPPTDIYAAYAGFDAVHADLGEAAADELPDEQRQAWPALAEMLAREGYDDAALVKAARFFGEDHLIATAVRAGLPGVAVFDGNGIEWFPRSTSRRPLGPTEAYCIYKGRRLLKAFGAE